MHVLVMVALLVGCGAARVREPRPTDDPLVLGISTAPSVVPASCASALHLRGTPISLRWTIGIPSWTHSPYYGTCSESALVDAFGRYDPDRIRARFPAARAALTPYGLAGLLVHSARSLSPVYGCLEPISGLDLTREHLWTWFHWGNEPVDPAFVVVDGARATIGFTRKLQYPESCRPGGSSLGGRMDFALPARVTTAEIVVCPGPPPAPPPPCPLVF